ncbi:hypothetical protein BALOs_1816 [Halobacteriovorax sp. BALOs_7]|uniref:hypothetical protein n=1 Tax=Halobacteriovorax sp. BALOs_7 TaxID=2109558 RepID=UPI000EA1D276|nr:hypothetical protein [Halobacteriovorax sp. BALOs_7]AYF44816.1 hypothetical protein BALOs_1816 [Halobacteriovorax sp. BALOs_7]
MKLLIQLSIVAFIATKLMAAPIKLVHITNDEDKSYYHLGINVDDETLEVESLYKNEFDQNGKVISTQTYTLQQLLKGVTLVERSDRQVVKIKASNLNPSDGADITIDTLYSGINGERKHYDASVERVGSDWKFNFESRASSKLHFVSNKKFLIGTIGIKDIKRVK